MFRVQRSEVYSDPGAGPGQQDRRNVSQRWDAAVVGVLSYTCAVPAVPTVNNFFYRLQD